MDKVNWKVKTTPENSLPGRKTRVTVTTPYENSFTDHQGVFFSLRAVEKFKHLNQKETDEVHFEYLKTVEDENQAIQKEYVFDFVLPPDAPPTFNGITISVEYEWNLFIKLEEKDQRIKMGRMQVGALNTTIVVPHLIEGKVKEFGIECTLVNPIIQLKDGIILELAKIGDTKDTKNLIFELHGCERSKVSFFTSTPRDFKQVLLRKDINEISSEKSQLVIELPKTVQPSLELGKLGETQHYLVIRREYGYFVKEELERISVLFVNSSQDPVSFGQIGFDQS
ncbi:MAG: hypothetical protein KAR35_09730 [Candidatus Heimdallarchaeota archaeon]|nr:hypothetical protein [Candidatus Heimdallarchaeota archaeon]MCK5049637.1 hypothetical protein [Candidatus Heimdallarchaeota archaeon]